MTLLTESNKEISYKLVNRTKDNLGNINYYIGNLNTGERYNVFIKRINNQKYTHLEPSYTIHMGAYGYKPIGKENLDSELVSFVTSFIERTENKDLVFLPLDEVVCGNVLNRTIPNKLELPIKREDDGSYRVLASILNMASSINYSYESDSFIKELESKDSDFSKKLEREELYVSWGFPDESERTLENIHLTAVGDICGVVTGVEIERDLGRTCAELDCPEAVGVYIYIKPCGPKKDLLINLLKEGLMYPPIGTKSVGVLSHDDNGIANVNVKQIYSFDVVDVGSLIIKEIELNDKSVTNEKE